MLPACPPTVAPRRETDCERERGRISGGSCCIVKPQAPQPHLANSIGSFGSPSLSLHLAYPLPSPLLHRQTATNSGTRKLTALHHQPTQDQQEPERDERRLRRAQGPRGGPPAAEVSLPAHPPSLPPGNSFHAPSLLCPCFLVSWVGFSAGYSICARLQAVLVTDMGGMIRGLQFQRPRFFAFEFSGQECLNTCSFGEDLFGFESFSPSSEFR